MLITVTIAGAVLISDVKDQVDGFTNTEEGLTLGEMWKRSSVISVTKTELFENISQTGEI